MASKLNRNPETVRQFDYGIRDLSLVIDNLKLAEACFYNVWQDSGGAYDGGVLISAYTRITVYKEGCEKLFRQLRRFRGDC